MSVKLWAYRCELCTHHTLSVSRPYRCAACRKKEPALVGYVSLNLMETNPKSGYTDWPDMAHFGGPGL